jgi:hypothetical protein
VQLLVEKTHYYLCKNIQCKKEFENPKIITHYVCPFCETEIDEKDDTSDQCSHYFGYLGKREKGETIPAECIECMRSIECILNKISSKDAAQEIQKWYV